MSIKHTTTGFYKTNLKALSDATRYEQSEVEGEYIMNSIPETVITSTDVLADDATATTEEESLEQGDEFDIIDQLCDSTMNIMDQLWKLRRTLKTKKQEIKNNQINKDIWAAKCLTTLRNDNSS